MIYQLKLTILKLILILLIHILEVKAFQNHKQSTLLIFHHYYDYLQVKKI
jgi:hypothetical protein